MTIIPNRIPLNPCDSLYLAHHRLLESRAQGGTDSFFVFEADGRADPERLRQAFAAAMNANPVTLATLRTFRLTGRPYWQVPTQRRQAADLAAERAYSYDDLRNVDDWRSRLEHLHGVHDASAWTLSESPQIRLEHYDLPQNRTRLYLCFSHVLMGAVGGMSFMAEMCRLQQRSTINGAPAIKSNRPQALAQDDRPFDILAGIPIHRRIKLARRVFRSIPSRKKLRITPLLPPPYPKTKSMCFLHKFWQTDKLIQLRTNAQRWTAAGPAQHARFLALCVVRALHRLYTERGVETDAYLLPFPTNVTNPVGLNKTSPPLPLTGNYLVSPTLCIRRDAAEDRRAVAQAILQQIQTFVDRRENIAQWAFLWLASLMRSSMYQLVLRLPLGFESLASGFSYFRPVPSEQPIQGSIGVSPVDSPPRQNCGIGVSPVDSPRRKPGVDIAGTTIAGATITNAWATTAMTMPPGWNPVFNRIGDKLNFTLSWAHPAVDYPLARRYADLIEEEIFEGA